MAVLGEEGGLYRRNESDPGQGERERGREKGETYTHTHYYYYLRAHRVRQAFAHERQCSLRSRVDFTQTRVTVCDMPCVCNTKR